MPPKAKDQIAYELLEAACARFNLGHLRGVEPITGGLLHRLYRCTTDTGDFAIKEMVAQAQDPGFKERIETSSKIEKQAAKTDILIPEIVFVPHTLEVLAPITLDNSDLHFVRVHRWVEGAIRTMEESFTELDWLSKTIAHIHSLDMGGELPDRQQIAAYKPIQWNQWVNNVDPRPTWSNLFSQTLETIEQFENLILKWQNSNKNRPLIPSHRDLTAKNILLKDGQPLIVDWDNATWVIDPLQDVFTVAIDWSLARQGKLSEERIMSVVNAYLEVTGYLPAFDNCQIYCSDWASGILCWLAFNLNRIYHNDLRQRGIAEAEVRHILTLLLEVGSWVFGQAQQVSLEPALPYRDQEHNISR